MGGINYQQSIKIRFLKFKIFSNNSKNLRFSDTYSKIFKSWYPINEIYKYKV